MADLDWDLWAVVRSCNSPAAATTPAAAQEEPGTLSPSVVFHQNDNSSGRRRPYHGFEELHEVYNNFIKSQVSISPSTSSSPTSFVSLSDGFNDQQPPPPPLPPPVKHNSNPVDEYGDERKRTRRTEVVEVVAENFVEVDPWNWRKYGRKPIKTSPYPRNYYKCSSSSEGSKCPAKKYVEKSKVDPEKVIISYSGEHNHSPPHKFIRTH